jgi:hypothetical protein
VIRRFGVAAFAIVLAACAPNPAPRPSPTPPTAPTGLDPDHVLIAIEDISDWPGSEGTYDPRLATLTADGTLVARDPSRNVILPLVSTRLQGSALDGAWASVVGRGLAVDASLESPGLYDATTTTVRVDDGTRETALAIYGLGNDVAEGKIPPDERALRFSASAAIRELQARATGESWTPSALLLWWSISEDAPSGAEPRVVEWTPPVDLAASGKVVRTPVFQRCARLEGEEAEAVAALASTIPGDVAVAQRGIRYAFTVRPIYPDEAGVDCP